MAFQSHVQEHDEKQRLVDLAGMKRRLRDRRYHHMEPQRYASLGIMVRFWRSLSNSQG